MLIKFLKGLFWSSKTQQQDLESEDKEVEEYEECENDEIENMYSEGLIIGVKLVKGEDPTAFMSIADKSHAGELLAEVLIDLMETKIGTLFLDHSIKYLHKNPEDASIITTALAIAKNSIESDGEDDIAVKPTEVFNRE